MLQTIIFPVLCSANTGQESVKTEVKQYVDIKQRNEINAFIK